MIRLFYTFAFVAVSVVMTGCNGGGSQSDAQPVSAEEVAAHDAAVQADERAHMAEQNKRK